MKKGDKIQINYMGFHWDAIVLNILANNIVFVKTIGHGEDDDYFEVQEKDIIKKY